MAANANHLNDRRPQFTDPNENPGDRNRCDDEADGQRPWLFAEPALDPSQEMQHAPQEKSHNRNGRRQVEPPFRYVLAGTRDVTDIDRVQARDNSGESLFALSLPIGRTKTVAIHEFLDQLRVDDEVTMVRWRPKVQRFNWFRGPCAV